MELTRLGPVGGEGGKPFDGYTIPDDARLTAIHIYTEWVIDALQFDYAWPDREPGGRPPVGGLGGSHHVFYLDEDEYLTGISGRCGWYIDTIRFHTNKRESPLYGGGGGERDFALHAPPGYEVAGLFGRSDWYMDALGVTLRPLALRQELAEGAILAEEADAERAAADAEATLDEMIDAIAAEMAAEAAARRGAGDYRAEGLADIAADPEAMLGETAAPEAVAALEAALFDELVAALEEETEAEFQAEAGEEAWDEAYLIAEGLSAASAWQPLDNDAAPLDVLVLVRRAPVAGEAELDALEEATMAEAIAAFTAGGADEGTVDVAVYTQVIDDDSGAHEATVMAVAAEAAGGSIDAVEDAALDGQGEAAVMVTDEIESDDDLAALEEQAVEEALFSLEEELGYTLEDADVTIYTGLTSDTPDGRVYGAVVAIARQQAGAPIPDTPTADPGASGSRGPAVVQFGGMEPRPQDLQLVEGIGPKIAALLIEHAIYDLGQLAETPVERLRDILGGAGKRFRLADPGTWPRQATLAAAGDWAALTELQTRLKAGK